MWNNWRDMLYCSADVLYTGGNEDKSFRVQWNWNKYFVFTLTLLLHMYTILYLWEFWIFTNCKNWKGKLKESDPATLYFLVNAKLIIILFSFAIILFPLALYPVLSCYKNEKIILIDSPTLSSVKINI